jgi:hypothetical protein
MDYNHVIENIGKVIDAAGVAVIVVGMLISTGAAVVELSRHETGIYRHFRQQLGRTICWAWNCWSSATSSALSPLSPPSPAWQYSPSSS